MVQNFPLMRLIWFSLLLLVSGVRLIAESSSLLGATRQEIVDSYGPPTSQMSTQGREVLVYPEGRVTLDQGKVVEITLPPPTNLPATSPTVKSIRLRAPRPKEASVEATKSPAEREAFYEKWMTRAALATALLALLGWVIARRKPKRVEKKRVDPIPRPPTEPVVVLKFKPFSTRPPVMTHPPVVVKPPEEPLPPGTTPPLPTPALERLLTLRLLNKLEWRRLEMLASRYFEPLGFIAQRRKVADDGTVDIDFFEKGTEGLYGRIRCKGWLGEKVGTAEVRHFGDDLEAAGLAGGQFLITGEFTSEAKELAEFKNIELINGAQVVERLNALAPAAREDLVGAVLAGDYATPTCVKCNVKMVLRGDGEKPVWVCRNHPLCEATMWLRPTKD